MAKKKKQGKKNESGDGGVRKPSFAEIRKIAKGLGIKSVGKEQEGLHEEVLDAIAKKFDAGKLKTDDKLLKFYKETADLEDDPKDKKPSERKPTKAQKAAAKIKEGKKAEAKKKKAATPKKKSAPPKKKRTGPFVYETVAAVLKKSKNGLSLEQIFTKVHKVHSEKPETALKNTIKVLVGVGLKKRGIKAEKKGDKFFLK